MTGGTEDRLDRLGRAVTRLRRRLAALPTRRHLVLLAAAAATIAIVMEIIGGSS